MLILLVRLRLATQRTFVKSFRRHHWIKVKRWRRRFIGPSILKLPPLSAGVVINSAAVQRECLYQVYYLWPENCCLWFILKWNLHTRSASSQTLKRVGVRSYISECDSQEKKKIKALLKNCSRDSKKRKKKGIQRRGVSPWFRSSLYYSHTPPPNKSPLHLHLHWLRHQSLRRILCVSLLSNLLIT